MSTLKVILGILGFALVTAIVYAWGLHKSVTQAEDLSRNLIYNCGSRVVKYLKKNNKSITTKQIAKEIEGVTAGQFWSKKKLKVQDGRKFAPDVIAFLLDQQYIEQVSTDSYRLKK